MVLGFWITMVVFAIIIGSLVFSARRKDRGGGPMGDGSAGVRVTITDPPYLRAVEEIRVMPQHLPEAPESRFSEPRSSVTLSLEAISPAAGPGDAARP